MHRAYPQSRAPANTVRHKHRWLTRRDGRQYVCPPLKQPHDQPPGAHEAHLSTQQTQTQTYPRFPPSHEDPGRPTGTQITSREAPRPPERLTLIARSGLPRRSRLDRPAQFAAAMKHGCRTKDAFFNMYAIVNALPYGRLGLTVSKQVAAHAVDRNRVKRQVRESYRSNRARLAGLDVVVTAKPAAGEAENAALRGSLTQHWEQAARRCRKS